MTQSDSSSKSRKELTREYKERSSPMGVFCIRNTANGRMLVDYSTDVQAKYNRHVAELKFGNHRNKALQEDWKKLGSDSFEYELLSELPHRDDPAVDYPEELRLLMQMVIDDNDIVPEQLYL